MACDKRRHHGFGEGTVHGNLLEEEQETPGPQGKGPLWVAWVDAARPWKKTDQCGGPHSLYRAAGKKKPLGCGGAGGVRRRTRNSACAGVGRTRASRNRR